MVYRLGVLVLAATLAPATGSAQCPQGVLPGALAARLDQSGVAVLEQVLIDRLPSDYAIPAEPYLLADCYDPLFDDTVVTPHNGTIHVELHSMRLTLEPGAVVLDGVIDAAAAADLDMVLCAMPDAQCHAALASQGISVHARVVPGVSQCQLLTPITELDVVIDPYATSVDVGECGLYDEIAALVYDWFRESIVASVSDTLESWVQAELPAMVAAMSSEIIADGMDMYGLHLDAVPERLTIGDDGVTVSLAANLVSIDGASTCLPPGSALPAESASTTAPTFGGGMLSISASEAFVQRAIRSAWLAGWMCFDTRDYDLGLGAYLGDMMPDAFLEATLVPQSPPSVRLSPTIATEPVEITLDEVYSQLAIGSASLATSYVDIHGGARFGGALAMDRSVQNLVLSLMSVQSRPLTISAPGAELLFSEPAIANLLDNAVMPAFRDTLSAFPLTTSLFLSTPVAARLVEVAVDDGTHLRAEMEIIAVDPDDHVPPVTVVTREPPRPSPPDVAVSVASGDDVTPREFLRHRVLIDGVPAPGEDLTGDELLITDVPGGPHTLTLAAVDLTGNLDETPVSLDVLVDDTSPTVTVDEAPTGLIAEDQATLRYTARDDITPPGRLRLRYTASLIQTVGPDLPLYAGDLAPGEDLRLTDLPEDSVVRVTVFAVDEAGNEGKEEVAFAVNVNPTFSCRALPGSGLAALVAIALLRSRRRVDTSKS